MNPIIISFVSIILLLAAPKSNNEKQQVQAIVDKAIQYYFEQNSEKYKKEMLKLKDKWPQYYHLTKGDFYFLEDNPKQAINEYEKSLDHDPKLSNSYWGLARAYFILGNYKQALNECTKAIQLKPKDTRYRLTAIAILIGKEDLDEALKRTENITKEFPDIPSAYYFLGEIYTKMDKQDKALKAYLEAIQKDKDKTLLDSYLPAIKLLIKMDKKEQARKLWDEYYKLNPDGITQSFQEISEACLKTFPTAGPPGKD